MPVPVFQASAVGCSRLLSMYPSPAEAGEFAPEAFPIGGINESFSVLPSPILNNHGIHYPFDRDGSILPFHSTE